MPEAISNSEVGSGSTGTFPLGSQTTRVSELLTPPREAVLSGCGRDVEQQRRRGGTHLGFVETAAFERI